MKNLLFLPLLITLIAGCSSKPVERQEFASLPVNAPSWAKDGAIKDGNFSAVGNSTLASGDMQFAMVDAMTKAKATLRSRVESASFELARKLLANLTSNKTQEELAKDAQFMSALASSQAIKEFVRDEIWYSPMGDQFVLYTIPDQTLKESIASSFWKFIRSDDEYIKDEEEKLRDFIYQFVKSQL